MEECVRDSARADGNARGFAQTGMNLLGLIQHLTTTLIVVVAYYQIARENLSMGGMIACVILANRALAPLNLFASLLMRLQQTRRALRGLNQLMQAADETDGAQKITVSDFSAEVRISHLKFGFGENPEAVLKGIDLDIGAGERVALLGRIGCGKTTLLRLLMSFYDPREGGIRISGVDTRQWSVASLRRHIGYVAQDPCLLHGNLRSNLVAGCAGLVDDDAIMRAIERAGLSDYVASLPNGLATPVSEAGKSLSGGQRQSIALARAYLLEPELLVLDEPTSAMDVSTERTVLANLQDYLDERPNRTLVVATHRRSILPLVERIVVLDQGTVISDGPRDRVIAQQPSGSGARSAAGPRPATPSPGCEATSSGAAGDIGLPS
jgi:ATP-binding cassette subfamily C protein LapB